MRRWYRIVRQRALKKMGEGTMDKRQFLAGLGLGAGLVATSAFGQVPRTTDSLGRSGEERARVVPRSKAKTTKMYLAPPSWPNAISVQKDKGFWVAEQRHDRNPEKAWLLDFKTGKVLHEVITHCEDTSGMAYGDGFIWSGANGASVKNPPNPPINGIFQTDMNSKQISRRQIPFGPKEDGGSCHGMSWQDGKLWLYANRLASIVRVDAKSWEVDLMFPVTRDVRRLHGIEYSNGVLWQVCGTQDPKVGGYEGYVPGLVKYDAATGKVLEFVDLVPGSADIHDICAMDGQLYGVDAGEHPGWPINEKYAQPGFPEINSPTGGYIVKIDLI
jgi:hypothetical protein